MKKAIFLLSSIFCLLQESYASEQVSGIFNEFKVDIIENGNHTQKVFSFFPKLHYGVMTLHQSSTFDAISYLQSESGDEFCREAAEAGFAIIITDPQNDLPKPSYKDASLWAVDSVAPQNSPNIKAIELILQLFRTRGSIRKGEPIFSVADEANMTFVKLLTQSLSLTSYGDFSSYTIEEFTDQAQAIQEAALAKPTLGELYFNPKIEINENRLIIDTALPAGDDVEIIISNDRGSIVYSTKVVSKENEKIILNNINLVSKNHLYFIDVRSKNKSYRGRLK